MVTPAGQKVPPDMDSLPDPDRTIRYFNTLELAIAAVEKK